MKKAKKLFMQTHGEDLLANPIACTQYMVVKAVEAKLRKRMMLSNQTGLLQFLLSPGNKAAALFDAREIERILENPQGRKMVIRRTFRPIKTFADVGTKSRDYCAPVNAENEPKKEQVSELGFDFHGTLMSFKDSMMRKAPKDDTIAQEMADIFIRKLIAFENTFAATVTKRILSGNLVGNFKDGSTVKDLPLYQNNLNAVNPVAAVMMNQWMQEVGLSDTPVLVGGTMVSAYPQIRKIASPNLAGFDPSRMDDIMTIGDLSVPGYYGTTEPDVALMIAPGALQLFTRPTHIGEFVANENDPNSRRYLLTSPFTGLTWDAYWKRGRECANGDFEIEIELSLIWDVLGLPSCWSDDACMAGVKDVWKVNIVCDDTTICDIDRSTICLDVENLPLNPDTIVTDPSSVLCANPASLILNISEMTNARQHTVATASTDAVIGLVFGGSTLNFLTPITLGDAPGAAALKLAVQAAIGMGGVVVASSFSTPNTTLTIITDDSIAQVELIVDDAANIELATTVIAKACRVKSIVAPSTGATSSTLRIVHAAIDTTLAFGAAIAQTDAVGIAEDFFVTGETPWTFGAATTVTYTDSASQTAVRSGVLCSAT